WISSDRAEIEPNRARCSLDGIRGGCHAGCIRHESSSNGASGMEIARSQTRTWWASAPASACAQAGRSRGSPAPSHPGSWNKTVSRWNGPWACRECSVDDPCSGYNTLSGCGDDLHRGVRSWIGGWNVADERRYKFAFSAYGAKVDGRRTRFASAGWDVQCRIWDLFDVAVRAIVWNVTSDGGTI